MSNGWANRAIPGPGDPSAADPIGRIRFDSTLTAGLDSRRPGFDAGAQGGGLV
jgi:hypothetical protein